jgi:hypothetical protein
MLTIFYLIIDIQIYIKFKWISVEIEVEIEADLGLKSDIKNKKVGLALILENDTLIAILILEAKGEPN